MKSTPKIKTALVLFLLPLLSFTVAHKFYLSVTHVTYSEKDRALQITSRMFIDDINAVFKERYGVPGTLGPTTETQTDGLYFEKYLRTKFLVEINGEQASFTLLGKKYDADMVVCFLEVPNVSLEQVKNVAVTNEILTDLFDEQQNVIHFKIDGKKKSFVLLKSNPKGMLNL